MCPYFRFCDIPRSVGYGLSIGHVDFVTDMVCHHVGCKEGPPSLLTGLYAQIFSPYVSVFGTPDFRMAPSSETVRSHLPPWGYPNSGAAMLGAHQFSFRSASGDFFSHSPRGVLWDLIEKFCLPGLGGGWCQSRVHDC